jgi:hypothetical protein
VVLHAAKEPDAGGVRRFGRHLYESASWSLTPWAAMRPVPGTPKIGFTLAVQWRICRQLVSLMGSMVTVPALNRPRHWLSSSAGPFDV